MPSRERKAEYFIRAKQLFEDYKKIIVVGANNVGSKQFQEIRSCLRGKAVVLMGKNTMMRRIIADLLETNNEHPVASLLPHVKGNIGFVYTNDDVAEIRNVIREIRVSAPARAGQIADVEVVVPKGPTGCDPGQTQWFQALNVPTKITKGQIEIVSDLRLIEIGSVVGGSEAALLQKLDIRPFSYGLSIDLVYDDGAVFDAKVLDITESDLKTKFAVAVRSLAAVSMSSGYPTLASLPHQIGGAVRQMIAISAASGYTFKEMSEWDKYLNMSPEELAKLASANVASGDGAAEEAAAEEEEEEEEEDVDLGGGGMFGDAEAY